MAKNLIIVCNAKKAKLSDSPCCSNRGASKLICAFNDKIEKAGLEDEYEVKEGGCMKNCQKGISVKIHPDQVIYGNVKVEHLNEIVFHHLINGKPIAHLRTERINRFLEF